MTLKIRPVNLDFDSIKSGLKEFLGQQTEFKDYNFDASGWSAMLDVLAYNTHLNGLTANYMVNESFLDTAQKRSSIVSHAKMLGYIPRSIRSPISVVNLSIEIDDQNNTAPETITLDEGTEFSTSVNNESFVFTTIQKYMASRTGNRYFFNNISVYEGSYATSTFTYNIDPTLEIPNENVDVDTVRVFVDFDPLDDDPVYSEFKAASFFLDIDSNSKTYFIQENYNNKYEIYFGDNVTGVRPPKNSTVKIKYITSKGPKANGAKKFVLASSLWEISSFNYTSSVGVVSSATGGTDRESDDSIKFNAINSYGIQNRAVTKNDYKSLILLSGANISTVNVWGGQENVPPRFGALFICGQPNYGDFISENDKEKITAILKQKSILDMKYVYVDPTYNDVVISASIIYNQNTIQKTLFEVENEIKILISKYVKSQLSTFNGKLYTSKLSKTIDEYSPVVLGSDIVVKLIKKIAVVPSTITKFDFTFNNELRTDLNSPTIESNNFITPLSNDNCMFISTVNGKIDLVNANTRALIKANVGSYNYLTGSVNISGIVISQALNNRVTFTSEPKRNNAFIQSYGNTIYRLDDADINVTLQAG